MNKIIAISLVLILVITIVLFGLYSIVRSNFWQRDLVIWDIPVDGLNVNVEGIDFTVNREIVSRKGVIEFVSSDHSGSIASFEYDRVGYLESGLLRKKHISFRRDGQASFGEFVFMITQLSGSFERMRYAYNATSIDSDFDKTLVSQLDDFMNRMPSWPSFDRDGVASGFLVRSKDGLIVEVYMIIHAWKISEDAIRYITYLLLHEAEVGTPP